MSLPALKDWDSTRDTLQQVALVLGAVRVGSVDPRPNDLHFSLDVTASGLTTAELSVGGELQFRIAEMELVYMRDGDDVFALSIAGHTQKSLLQAATAELAARGKTVEPALKHITFDVPLEFDRGLASDYLHVLDMVFAALARFRARLSGYLSPLVLWPHHFDMAFLLFPGDGQDEHKDPHLAFGFAPFSAGLDRPYIYAYGWSQKAGYLDIPLESPAQAVSDGYTGLYAAYDDLRLRPDFGAAIENMLLKYTRDAAKAL